MADQTEPKIEPKKKPGRPKGIPWTDEQKARASARKKKEWAQKIEVREEQNRKDLATYSELTGIALKKMDEKPALSPTATHSRNLREARVALDLPQINIKDPKQVEQRCREYLDFCELRNRRPQVVGLSNWLGVSRETMHSWREGRFERSPATPVIQRYFAMVEEYMVEDTMACDKNPASLIFILKNSFGYRDQTEITVNANTQNDREMSDDEIADWYLNEGKIETTFKEE